MPYSLLGRFFLLNSFLRKFAFFMLIFCLVPAAALVAEPANGGGVSSGQLRGTVTDPSGAVIPNATVHLAPVGGGTDHVIRTDANGQFLFNNLPMTPYKLTVSAQGFASFNQSVTASTLAGGALNLVLAVAGLQQTVTVDADNDLANTDTSFRSDVDREQMMKLPLESESSALSSLVTLSTPGVSADSNGMMHGLGDHASNSFSVDGQSITDQQSKVFSNSLPSNSIQSLEVITGAPPAEYGGKTSLVIVATTRSGQGVKDPTGSLSTSYGSFGSATTGFDLAWGGEKWGNFFEADGLRSGRFLDPPEFTVFHDKGNEENLFDRIDRNITPADSLHLNLNFSRSWFQTPNSYDNLDVSNIVSGGSSANPVWGNVGNADQRSMIDTFNIAPSFTRVMGKNSIMNLGASVRRDDYRYYPSDNPLADLGPSNLQQQSIAQSRMLTNAALHGDISLATAHHTLKGGFLWSSTFLRERDSVGIVDPAYQYSAPCVDADGNPVAGNLAGNCGTLAANPDYTAVLSPYDLTRGGSMYLFRGQANVKETALYIEDQIKTGNWQFNLGIRGDLYNGLTVARQAEPRLGLSYNFKHTGTVIRASYARTLESPFNENLVLSSEGCQNSVLSVLLSCSSGVASSLPAGFRNEFHAGFQQSVGTHLVVSGEYIWKYTHNAFDFAVLGSTPITFPIDWHNSKIPGYALHVEMPEWHHMSAYTVLSSVAARFFPEQVGGAGATVGQSGLPFRIDHDEKLNQTTHAQYTLAHGGPLLKGLWGGLNWRYDSGQVAGAAPCYGLSSANPNSPCDATSTTLNGLPAVKLSDLTADEQFQAGLYCGKQHARPGAPLPDVCLASEFGSTLLSIPAPGTADADHNPARVAQRNLFDASLGKENLFGTKRYKVDFDLTAVNVTNVYSLYNFLSTFSGTHYLSPRSISAKFTLNF